MKCMSCEIVIPPEWKACIVSNLCPKCGGAIMDDETKFLVGEMSTLLKKIELAAEGVKEVVLSSFNLQEFNSAKQQGPEVFTGLKIAENPVQQFLARGNPKLAKREPLSEIVKRVQATQETVDYEVSEGEEFVEQDYTEDEYIPEQPTITAKSLLAKNSLIMSNSQQDQVSDQQLVQAFGDPADVVDDLPEALQVDRLKRLRQRHGVATGTGMGSFRRG